jgi:hypothetical protein
MMSLAYHALSSEAGEEEIRLLKIPLGSLDDPIEFELQTVPLTGNVEFSALSYVWGRPEPTGTVICNGTKIQVGINLFSALNRLRQRTRHVDERDLMLWVDAISINQADDDEKGKQVQMMRSIYEKAVTTYIWLGEEEADTGRAFELLDILNKAKEAQEAAGDKRTYSQLQSKEKHTFYGLPEERDPSYTALSDLLRRAWFTRVWVIQELAVSKKPCLWCGDHEVGWDAFMTPIIYAAMNFIPRILQGGTHEMCIVILGNMRSLAVKKSAKSLLDLLFECRAFVSTDPRDKIYALCGLADDVRSGALKIVPDYKKSVNALYQEVAYLTMKGGGNPNVLSIPRVPKPSPYLELADLPSWVPDWTVATSCIFSLVLNGTSDFQASGESNFEPSQDSESSSLELSGFNISSIQKIGDVPISDIPICHNIFERLRRVLNQLVIHSQWENICNLNSKTPYAHTGETLHDAYFQTILAGELPGGLDEAKKAYSQWYQLTRSMYRHVTTFESLPWANKLMVLFPCAKMYWDFYWLIKKGNMLTMLPFSLKMAFIIVDRRFFKTRDGHIGLGPGLARKGDCIALVKGVKTPLVLRAIGDSGRWELVGDCYVHGVMKGEKFDEEKCVDILVA